MKKNNKKRNKRKIIIPFIFIVLILLGGFILYNHYKEQLLFKSLKSNLVNINKFTVYGTHFNIEGSLDIKGADDAYLILKNTKEEIKINTIYTISDKLHFKTSNYINNGINLEKIKNDKYFIFLKVKNNKKYKLYSLRNNTDYNNINYISMDNNEINIKFKNKYNKPYLEIKSKKTYSNDYYDIVIDAGHGGVDPGAVNSNYHEADITLSYVLKLKDSLENKGYKVKLTRDTDTTLETYGENSRTAVPYEVKAKYVFSIHINSSEYIPYKGGVEVYASSNSDLTFAKSIADNIVNIANTNYSINKEYKVDEGVYVKTFTKDDINDSYDYAKENNFEPYSITTNTPYMYMIRETGGIITNAYIDGRNPKYKNNPYYNSNIGIEAYLIELGYINHSTDLKNLINNKDKYVEAITKSIDEHIKRVNN